MRARVDDSFFVEHALYFLSQADFSELVDRVDNWRHFELCTRAPDVCTIEPDQQARAKLRKLIETERAEAESRVPFVEYYEREGIEALLVFLHPTKPANDIEFADAIAVEVGRIVADLIASHPDWERSGLTYNLVGPYAARAGERDIIRRDMVRSGAIGLVGVMLVLFLLFRSFRALLTLTVPLLAGLIWAMGAAQLLLGHLTTMTSLITSLLMGLGIDAGIHLLSRARQERRLYDDEMAIRRAFDSLFAPLLVASTTTIGAFVVMSTSDYPAFREFGLLAGAGVGLCLLSMVTKN